MTKKILTLLLAISMVCTSVFAVFAIDEVSVNKSSKQSSAINTEDKESSVSDELNSQIPQATLQNGNNSGEKAYPGKVTLVGMWTDRSSKKIDEDREYKSSNDKIGKPVVNGGLLRGLAKTFLGWSDKPPVDNGHLAEGARYFSPEDTIGTVFPDGISEGAKLYAVYFSLLDNDAPFTSDLDNMSIRKFGEKFNELINKNKVIINKSISGEESRSDTPNYRDTINENNRTILDYYKNKVNNEVILSSEFSMDPTIALITYRNPVGSSQVRPILSRDYKERKGDNGEFNTADGKDAGYTYVDLNVELDEGFEIPEILYLEFFGYSWRPLYVMNENKEQLEILDPNNDASLGRDKNSFNSLVNNTNPRVRFGIRPNGASNITVRMILRESENEKILENNIIPDEGKTITETILNNMELKSLSKNDIKQMRNDLNDEELDKRVIRISDKKARELANSNGEKTLKVNGNIKGHMFVSAGEIKKGPFTIKLKSDTDIREIKANVLEFGYIQNSVYYKFVSGTKGKKLPDEIITKLPENKLANDKKGVLDQDKITLSKYKDVKVSDGVWSFRTWYVTDDKFENDPNLKAVTKEALVNSPDDLYLLGVWIFKADKTSKVKKTPQTSDNQPISLALALAIASATSMVLLQKKRKKIQIKSDK